MILFSRNFCFHCNMIQIIGIDLTIYLYFFQSLTVQATPYVDTIKEQTTAEVDLPIITAKGKLFSDPEVVLGM